MSDSPLCELLVRLVAALRDAAPRLDADLPFPQRTGIEDVGLGEPGESAHPRRCRLPVTVRGVGGVEKRVELVAGTGSDGPALSISDGAAFEERFRLATTPGEPPHEADVRRLFDALTDDLSIHFAAES